MDVNIDSLYYGRMYFPSSKLEGMHIRRVSPSWQYILSFVSDRKTSHGSAVRFVKESLSQVTAQFQRDVGKYSTEYIVSSDDLLLGFRGLWNFGIDPRIAESVEVMPVNPPDSDDMLSPPINGRLSAGLEMYYGLLNKGGGCISFALTYSSVYRFPIYHVSRPSHQSCYNDDDVHTSHGPYFYIVCHQSISLFCILLPLRFQFIFV
jgi:distribution and morphology protein 10